MSAVSPKREASEPADNQRPTKVAKPLDGAQSAGAPAAAYIRTKLPGFAPRLAIILGSGMGGVADAIEDKTEFPYSELPGFPVSTVQGHAGTFVCGTLEGVQVACLKGRVHLYEGTDPQLIRAPIYTFKELGCEIMFSTSAVGSLREDVGPGELFLLKDHINLQARNPLIGPNDPIGPRFPSLLNAYDPALRALIQAKAAENEINITEGVYLACLGPSFETPAEIKAFKILGADCVGMSVVPEVIVARHCDLRVATVSIVVNLAAGLTNEHITHDETLHFSGLAAGKVTQLVKSFIAANGEW
ncbi:xanthosine phosphorylase [Thecamonas trahens ATCC 50062]|uniref:Purine nucleoside phosphorylase n=1 Tax=Thecamonas trahens ATCC 50062 TaxID=461836 RepID=A0A0L0DKH7_THETB|nr:xanthosine phosphorylase [Thecamonas trahens ATCC 50062]KNC51873.1 xanthosine phosphorylase [Thecamonas trahens ATCC 50062]|eukprot:XP_013755732.1 xanthosine phosphorylase [Thecamonas trahens ATCC 50062]